MDKYDAYHNGYNCCEFADNPKYIQPKKEDIHNFIFLASWYEVIEAYEKMGQPEMASEISKAIITYGVTGEILSDNPLIIGVVRGMCTAIIDKSKARYAHSIENGKKGGRPPKYDKNQMPQLRNDGLTDQEIANNIGCTIKTVQRALANADDEI